MSEYWNYTQDHCVQNLLDITSEPFSCSLTSSAIFAFNPWLNPCDKHTYYKMCETEIDPNVLPYIECVIHVSTSSPFCIIVLRMCYVTYMSILKYHGFFVPLVYHFSFSGEYVKRAKIARCQTIELWWILDAQK